MIIENIGEEIIENNNVIDFKTQIIKNGASYYHTHSYYELFYILSGNAKHYFNGKTEMLSIGDLYFMKPGDTHNFLPTENDYSHRDIMFSAKLWQTVCGFLHFNIFDKLLPSQQKITLTINQIKDIENICYKLNSVKTISIEQSPYTYIILTEIIKNYLINADLPTEITSSPPWLISLINKLSLPENLFRDKSYTLSLFHYSYEHICRTFKQYMNQTITEFVNNKRLDYAAIMLFTTPKTIDAICRECGFESIPYFTKIFKAKFGSTPSAFRNK